MLIQLWMKMVGELWKKEIHFKIILSIIFVCIFILGFFVGRIDYDKLPKAELSEGLRGEYGIDKHINEKTIDKYLNRSDTVYRDVRMLVDTASWENKGGDRYLSGYVAGFEVIPSPYLVNYTEEYINKRVEKKKNLNKIDYK